MEPLFFLNQILQRIHLSRESLKVHWYLGGTPNTSSVLIHWGHPKHQQCANILGTPQTPAVCWYLGGTPNSNSVLIPWGNPKHQQHFIFTDMRYHRIFSITWLLRISLPRLTLHMDKLIPYPCPLGAYIYLRPFCNGKAQRLAWYKQSLCPERGSQCHTSPTQRSLLT